MSRLDEVIAKLDSAKLPDIDFDKYYQSHEEDNQKVKKVVDYFDQIEDLIENGHQITGAKMPFGKTHNLFRFREGEVTLWTGYNGHRKSMMLGFVCNEFIKQKEPVCIASFEMKPLNTITRMVKQHSGKSLLSYDEYSDFLIFTEGNLFIYDQQGGITPDRLMGVILYCAEQLNVKHFVIDSLMRVVAGEDKYNEQKDFVVKLCAMAIEKNIHIHLVHHVRDGNESTPSNRYSAKGSKSISDNVHNSLIVWANKEKNKDMPDAILKCDKQRDGEWEGSVALKFDTENLRFYEMYKEPEL